MKKKRFQKKQILGFIKSYHARKRQEERNVTDDQLTEILQQGDYDESNPETVVLTLHGYRVYLSHDEELIITVTAPDLEPNTPKTLSKKIGSKIKKKIEKKTEDENKKELTFEDYMKTWK